MGHKKQLHSALLLLCAGGSHPMAGLVAFSGSREEGMIVTEHLAMCQAHPTSHLSVIRHTSHVYCVPEVKVIE